MKPQTHGLWLITFLLFVTGCGLPSTNTVPAGPVTLGVSSPCPYLYATNGIDDSSDLRTRLQTCNWVQIQSPTITLLNPVILKHSNGAPINNVIIEPAPSITGTIQVNTFFHAILVAGCSNRQLVKCLSPNPSRAAFEYDGSFTSGFILNANAPVGATSIVIKTPTSSLSKKFVVGEFAYLNDATTTGMVGDGTMELRQVTNVNPSPDGLTATLTLDRALNRPHVGGVNGITVAHAVPILNTTIRNLKFTSISSTERFHPRVGIHLHLAKNAYIREITSTNWEGFSLVLLDTGGIGNRVRNTFAVGTGASDTDSPPQRYNGWGIGVEGQEGTSLEYSGARGFSEGIIINYSYNTTVIVPDIVGSDINYGVRIWHGVGGNIGHKVGTVCSFFGPTLNTKITRDLTQPATAFPGQILNTQTSISYGFGSKASTQVDSAVNINSPTSEALVTPCT
jgi:hypothetical protein